MVTVSKIAFVTAIALMVQVATGLAQPGATVASTQASAGQMPSAAELLQQVQAAEAWVNDVKSFDLEMQVQWTKDHTGKTQPPGHVRVTFDATRVCYVENDVIQPGMFEIRLWDGKGCIHRSNIYAQPEYCSYLSQPQDVMWTVFGYVPWLRATSHPFWFIGKKNQVTNPLGEVREWESIGEQDVRGVRCYIMERPQQDGTSRQRLCVGAADRRLYGNISLRLPEDAQERTIDLVREYAAADGTRLDSTEQVVTWAQRLPAAKREGLGRRLSRDMRDQMIVTTEHWTQDYREVAPGRFCPMTMSYTILTRGQKSQCEVKVTHFAIDQPLDDKLFTPDLKLTEGVQINDYTHNPPLVYPYKANRNPEEWKQIEETARQGAANTR